LKHLHHELRTTTIYVTHDQIEAMTLADRVVVMSKAQVQQVGTPEAIYNDPANLFVAGFVGSPPMNLIEGRLDGGVFTAPGVRVAGFGVHTQSVVVLGVRAEDLGLTSSEQAPVQGEVFSCELTGDATLLTLQVGAQRVCAKAGKNERAAVGQHMGLSANPASCLLFDRETQARLRFAANAAVA
jgi:multiple sugar transport system ATP-binding protein